MRVTFEELQVLLSVLIEDGEMKLEVEPYKTGYKIKVIDSCEYSYELDGDSIDSGCDCIIVTLYVDEKGFINVIDNGFGLFTKANKNRVIYIASLIGTELIGDDWKE